MKVSILIVTLHITKADKADAIVLWAEGDYALKMHQLLNDTDI